VPFRAAGARSRLLAPNTCKGQEPEYPMFHMGAGGGCPLVPRSEFRCPGSSIYLKSLTMYRIDLLV